MDMMISLNLQNKKALVVGGGKVACGKTKKLRAAGAEVTVISPFIVADLLSLDCEFQKRAYCDGDEDGYFIVIAATDDLELNRKLYENCDSKGILCQSVSSPSHFSVNASREKYGIGIAVTTGGRDPGFARHLAQELAESLDESVAARFEAHARLRAHLLARDIPIPQRRRLLRESLSLPPEEIDKIREEI